MAETYWMLLDFPRRVMLACNRTKCFPHIFISIYHDEKFRRKMLPFSGYFGQAIELIREEHCSMKTPKSETQ